MAKPLNALQIWERQDLERRVKEKPHFLTFDEYVKVYPEAEKYRNW